LKSARPLKNPEPLLVNEFPKDLPTPERPGHADPQPAWALLQVPVL
jgi:hypothetical protein